MNSIPVIFRSREAGAAEVEFRPPYTVLRVRVPAEPGLWCAWAAGDAGEVKIGVLEPEGREIAVERRFSRQALLPAGRLERVEIRPAGVRGDSGWRRAAPEDFRSEPFRRLAREPDTLFRAGPDWRSLAVPVRHDAPFPLPALFCFAGTRSIQGREYRVFAFNAREEPVFPTETG